MLGDIMEIIIHNYFMGWDRLAGFSSQYMVPFRHSTVWITIFWLLIYRILIGPFIRELKMGESFFFLDFVFTATIWMYIMLSDGDWSLK